MNILFDTDYDPFMDLSYFADPVYKPKTILEIENGVDVFNADDDDVPLLYDDTIIAQERPIIFIVSVAVEKEKSIFDETSPLFENKVYNNFIADMRNAIATKLKVLPLSVIIQELPPSIPTVVPTVVPTVIPTVVPSIVSSIVKVPTIVAPKSIIKEALEEDVLAEVKRKVQERRRLKKLKEEEQATFVVVIEPVSQNDLTIIDSYSKNMVNDVMSETLALVFEDFFEVKKNETVVVPIKNPVGRPRKNAIADPNAVKNPVGRPRKMQAVVPEVKNPVGRPRKVAVAVPEAEIELIIPPAIELIVDEMENYEDDYDADIENYLRLIAEANKPAPAPVVIPKVIPKVNPLPVDDDEDYEIKEQVNMFGNAKLKKRAVDAPAKKEPVAGNKQNDEPEGDVFKAFELHEDIAGEIVMPEGLKGDDLPPPPSRLFVEEKQVKMYQVPYNIRNAKLNRNVPFVLQPEEVKQRSVFQLEQEQDKAKRRKVVSKDDIYREPIISSRMKYVNKAKRSFEGKKEEIRGFQAFKKLQDDVKRRKELAKGELAYM